MKYLEDTQVELAREEYKALGRGVGRVRPRALDADDDDDQWRRQQRRRRAADRAADDEEEDEVGQCTLTA